MADRLRLPAHVVRDMAFAFVESELGLTRNELGFKRRQAALVEGRALFVWIVKAHGPALLSYPRVGSWLGDRDHSTIQHLFKNKVPQLRQRDADFDGLCRRFQHRLVDNLETIHGDTRH